MTHRVAIRVFPDVEVLDFAAPFEVFTTAPRVHARRHPDARPPSAAATVARSLAPVRARAGLKVLPDHDLATCPAPQVPVVPGGVVDVELQQPDLIRRIAAKARSADLTASVCTGAFLLAEAGLLADRTATTHWEDVDALQAAHPDVRVVGDRRWVDEGRIVTAAGIAAGIDMSLHVVARLAGPELAAATARQMDVPHRPDAWRAGWADRRPPTGAAASRHGSSSASRPGRHDVAAHRRLSATHARPTSKETPPCPRSTRSAPIRSRWARCRT